MPRYLGTKCEKCGKLFAVARIVGPLPTFHVSVIVMLTCPYCGEKFEMLACDLVAFRATQVRRPEGL
jgi:uncharacterized OB-fold protein